MNNEKALEILKSAILMEVRGQAFYKNVADQAKDDSVKNVFMLMANEEKMHAEFLSQQYSEYKKNSGFVTQNLPAETEETAVNAILSPEIKSKLSGAGYEAAAISASIDMENKAVEIYTDFANQSDDPNVKALFLWLADWERGHVKILNQIDNELKEQIWFDNNFWPF
jgi:rubrerythrin